MQYITPTLTACNLSMLKLWFKFNACAIPQISLLRMRINRRYAILMGMVFRQDTGCRDVPCVSVWSASFRNSKHRPHVKQNRVKLLVCLPQNGQNIPRPQSMFGHHKLYLRHLHHNHNTFHRVTSGVWYIPFP